ncbi:MAG TPA: hypothetical protein VF094_08830 [Gaiellaceae bacterium]
MRKLSTAERRELVAAAYTDERVPLEQRSSRKLADRFGVSHRTILNDLNAQGIDERHAKPPAGGISKAELQAIVRDRYPTHSNREIAAEIGCSVQPVKAARRDLGLKRPRPAPKQRTPCLCSCGELARPGGKFVDWQHYQSWKRAPVEAAAGATAPLWNAGLTLDEIAEESGVTRHSVWYALRRLRLVDVEDRRRGKQIGRHYSPGRFVKCKARGYDFCPHGETERWIFPSHLETRRAEFLSDECWAQYRATVEWQSLKPLIWSTRERGGWDKWGKEALERWGARLNVEIATSRDKKVGPQNRVDAGDPVEAEILDRFRFGQSQREIADAFGSDVTRQVVRGVLRRNGLAA